MVNLKSVQQSNAALRSTGSNKTALFVGATSGLGLATLTEYTRYSELPKIYIVGRNEPKLSEIISSLQGINPQGKYIPIVSDISLFKGVDKACEVFKAQETSLDLLVMSPGYLKIARQEDNADGVEETISLRYYVRMRFVDNVLPQLKSPPCSRIVSIHGAGKEGHLIEDDLELKHNYSLQNGAMHTSTMNSLALEEIARSNPTISCVHVFPGLVMTPGMDVFCKDWVFPLRFMFQWVFVPLARLVTVGIQESGERHLFHSTSARYPPAATLDIPSGVPLPTGVDVANGADWNKGSGCYLLNWDGETIGNKELFDGYRLRGMGKTIWEHTHQVFNRSQG